MARTQYETLSIIEIYQFTILTMIGFWGSVFAYPITKDSSQNVVFYLNAVVSFLCLLLLLEDVWISSRMDQKKVRDYLWYMIASSLPFITTFTLVRSGYNFYWAINVIFASALLWLTLRNSFIFFIILISAILAGVVFGLALNLQVQILDATVFSDFALYSCVVLLMRITLVIHDRMHVPCCHFQK